MRELGIKMYFKSQDNNHWWDHTANDSIKHLQSTSTLCLWKLNNSLAKELISTHAKCATWMLDSKEKKVDLQSVVKDICKHLSANRERSYCSFFIQYELHFDDTLDDWKTKLVSFQWRGWTTHHGQAFPVSKIHKIPSPKKGERLWKMVVLKQQHASKWALPSIIVPNKINLYDFLAILGR